MHRSPHTNDDKIGQFEELVVLFGLSVLSTEYDTRSLQLALNMAAILLCRKSTEPLGGRKDGGAVGGAVGGQSALAAIY
ncbi:hypothetical protein PoB_006003500 [Plakobranchus ocellatus]|uniref:Uncharacterized protein n=1 Tax=Plakobranchus ocellatus TaxID=259542 RepID=A0AAV4CNW0_9GAST|nr:hypothetical protein PoB_006003500 [Plakobranchus ocellatus]